MSSSTLNAEGAQAPILLFTLNKDGTTRIFSGISPRSLKKS